MIKNNKLNDKNIYLIIIFKIKKKDKSCPCLDGYFDTINPNCLGCLPECATCADSTSCLTCSGRGEPPTCNKCLLGYPNTVFSDDLTQLIMTFDVEMDLNSFDPTTASNQNCIILLNANLLFKMGKDPICNLNLNNKKQVIINLGTSSTVT